jgi:hypothetical protein
MSEAGRQQGNQRFAGAGQGDGERPPRKGEAVSKPWYRRLMPIVALSAAWAITLVTLLASGLSHAPKTRLAQPTARRHSLY